MTFAQETEAIAVPVIPQATPADALSTTSASPLKPATKLSPITVTVDLIGGAKMTGAVTDVTSLPIRTAFGEASVPIAEVAGVRFASSEDASTTIILKNGDSITGATDLKLLTVETEWGTAKINGSAIGSILLIPDLKWTASIGLNGRRWSLVDSKTATPPAGLSNSGTQAQPLSPGATPSSRTVGR